MASLSDITVAISTNISNFQKGLDRAQRKLQKAGKGFKEAGTTMSQSLTLPLAAAGAASVKAASDYEDAVTQISKVSSQETASKLEGQIRDMSASIPVAQSELATLAADAARFGVEGSKNIANFTKTVSKMAATTDLESETAGKALAKISDQADIPREKIENLSSTIVRLGDSMATSQSEIVAAMSRGTIAARNFGLTGETITGLAARVNEVSESGERAGTRIKRLFQELQEPKKVKKVAEVLGMTTEEFRKMREESPKEALMAVVRSAGQAGQAGAEMANIFATSSRAALRGLATDTEGLNKVLNKASEEFQNPIALTQQYRKEQQKFSSQLQIALNKLRNVAITIGNKLMPFVLDLVNAIQRGISAFSSLSSRMQDIIIVGAGIAAALGPVLFIFGFFVSSVLPGLIAALSGVAGAFATLFGPVGAIGAALAGAAALIIQNWDEVKQFFQALGVTDALQALLSITKKVVQGIIGATVMLFNKVSSAMNGTGDAFAQAGRFIKNALSALFQNIKRIFNAVIDAAFLLFQALKHEFKLIQAIFQGDMDKALKHLEGMFSSVFLGIIKLISSTVKFILTRIQNLASALGPLGDKMADGIGSIKDSINENVSSLKDQFGLDETEQKMKDNQKAAKDFGSEMVKQGKRITSSLSLPSLPGGGGGQEDQGKDKPSLPQLVSNFSKDMQQQGGSKGQGESDIISQGTLRKAIALNERLIQQRRIKQQQQRKMQMLSQQTGEAVGRSLGRVQKALGASFSAIITGQKKASKAFQNFGKTVGNIFQKLLTQLIQMVIKMLAIKAITAVITGGGSGLLSGISGGSFGGQLLQGIGGIGSGLIGGNNSNNDQGGGPVFGTARGDELSIVQRRRNRENSKIGTDRGPN